MTTMTANGGSAAKAAGNELFRLQQETLHNYQTGNNQKNTCFARRWKDIAICDDFNVLAEYAVEMATPGIRIVDSSLDVIWSESACRSARDEWVKGRV